MKFRDLEDPLLTRDSIENRVVPEDQNYVARCDEYQLGERPFHGRKDLAQRTDGSADPLDRDTGVDQSFCGFEGHQVLKAVSAMPPWSLCAGFDEASLGPILQPPPRDLQQIHDVARPKTAPDGIHLDEGPKVPKAPLPSLAQA